jgi:hypothetical protein
LIELSFASRNRLELRFLCRSEKNKNPQQQMGKKPKNLVGSFFFKKLFRE